MHISLHSQSLRIFLLPQSNEGLMVKRFFHDHAIEIPKTLQTTILHADTAPYALRYRFLELLHSLHSKSDANRKFSKQDLLEMIDTPFSIRWMQDIALPLTITPIVVNSHFIQFKLNFPNPLIHQFIKSHFKSFVIALDPKEVFYLVKITTSDAEQLLLKLLQMKTIMHYKVNFVYKRIAVKNLLRKVKSHSERPKDYTLFEAYRILNSQPDDALALVKKRYKKLISNYHPDRVFAKDENLLTQYTKKFQSLQDAYNSVKAVHIRPS